MHEYKDVECYADEIKEIEVGKTTTFVRSNIRKEIILREGVIEHEDGTIEKGMVEREIWRYDEKQYDNEEYINFLTDQLKSITEAKTALHSEMEIMKKIIDFFATVFPIPSSLDE